MSEEKIEYKINVPMFEVGELERFDNHIHEIIKEYSKMMFKEKDQILTQRIIMKQEEEIEELKTQLQQKENIIKEVREYIEEHKQKGYRIPMSDDYEFWNELNENEIKELFGILDKENKYER